MLTGRLLEQRYRIGPLLGAGGQGDVYQVTDSTEPDSELVIKIFRSAPTTLDPRSAFFHQMQYAISIRHPNLLHIFDSGLLLPENLPYYVAEQVPGTPLSQLQETACTPRIFFTVILQTLLALDYLHQSGLLHLDIKPSNILINLQKETKVKVIDFGAVSPTRGDHRDRPRGTIRYTSPHILRGLPPKPSDDLISLGLLAFRWVSGRLPYHNLDEQDYLGIVQIKRNPFRTLLAKNLSFFSEWIRSAICGEFHSAAEALMFLRDEAAKSTIGRPHSAHSKHPILPNPEHGMSRNIRLLENKGTKILTDTAEQSSNRHCILISGPSGTGKARLAERVAYRIGQETGVVIQILQVIPQNSVINLMRTLFERYDNRQALSGMNPMDTLQRFLSPDYRQIFYRTASDHIIRLSRRLGGLLLVLKNVSSKDLYLLEFLLYVSASAGNQKERLLVIITTRDSAFQRQRKTAPLHSLENIHLEYFWQQATAFHLQLSPWKKRRVQQYIRRILRGKCPGVERQVQHFGISTPGDIRSYLTDLLASGSLYQTDTGVWKLRNPHTISAAQAYFHTPKNTKQNSLLFVVLSLYPSPITEEDLQPLFSIDPGARPELVRSIQDGSVLRDENRYYCVAPGTSFCLSRNSERRLRRLAATNKRYLLVLCHLVPTNRNAQLLLHHLDETEESSLYFCSLDAISALLRSTNLMARVRATLLFHRGHLESLQGRLTEARHSLEAISQKHVNRERWIQISLERANIAAKANQLTESLEACEEASRTATHRSEKSYVSAHIAITRALLTGPEHFPIPNLRSLSGNQLEPIHFGRIALRYTQALIWANQLGEARHWIGLALTNLEKTGQHFRYARSLRIAGRIARIEGDLQSALVFNQKALAILQTAPLPHEEIETLLSLFYLHYRFGEIAKLKSLLARISPLIPLLPAYRYNLIWPELVGLTYEHESPRIALRCFRQMESMAKLEHSAKHQYVAIQNQARLERSIGHTDRAEALSRRAERLQIRNAKSFPPRLRIISASTKRSASLALKEAT